MASTTKTPNYNLSQFADDDIPQWRTDYNGDMTKIDTAIKDIDDKVLTADIVGTGDVDVFVDTQNIKDRAVTAAKIDFSTLGGNYSFDEQDTGFTYYTGDKIYKKTFYLGADSIVQGAKHIAHGIPNLGYCIDFLAMTIEGDPTTSAAVFRKIPYTNTSGATYVMVEVDKTNISVYSAQQRNWHLIVTLYYTKI